MASQGVAYIAAAESTDPAYPFLTVFTVRFETGPLDSVIWTFRTRQEARDAAVRNGYEWQDHET